MDILIKGTQFLFSLSILIVLHEFGHFIPAKLFGTRVEKFYLFFPYKFSLFKKRIGNTEWGIGWIPLGGFVKISGMIDESMDTEQMEKPVEPWEFRSKPAWQRLIIMLGGVTVNVILGFVIYIMIVGIWGKTYIPKSQFKNGIYADSLANVYGIETGDMIESIDGKPVNDLSAINRIILLESPKTISFTKKGSSEVITKKLSEDIDWNLFEAPNRSFISLPLPIKVDSVPQNSFNREVLKKNDEIISINNIPTKFFQDFKKELNKITDTIIDIDIVRNGNTIPVRVKLKDKKLGFYNGLPNSIKDTTVYFGFFGSIKKGSETAIKAFKGAVIQLKFVFSKKGSEDVGGFISIGKLFPASWNWKLFWELTAMLSMVLAVMNLLPIPALDGGHVLFLIYEMISGRPPHKKFMEISQYVGMIILLGLLLFANGNDIFKLFK